MIASLVLPQIDLLHTVPCNNQLNLRIKTEPVPKEAKTMIYFVAFERILYT